MGCLGSDSVTVGNLSSAGQDPKQRVRVLHGVRGHQRELHVNFSLVQKGGSLALEAEHKALTLCVIRLLEPVLCGRCLGMECNAPASSDSPAAWHTAVRRACHFFTECQADDLVQPEADMENLHLRRHGWMPLRASNFPMLTRASDSGMGELLPAVFGARAIASRTDSVIPLWRHGVQACSGCQQEGHGAAATEGVWHRAAESSHACLLGQYHLFLPCLPGLLRSIFHDSVNLALLSVAREVH